MYGVFLVVWLLFSMRMMMIIIILIATTATAKSFFVQLPQCRLSDVYWARPTPLQQATSQNSYAECARACEHKPKSIRTRIIWFEACCSEHTLRRAWCSEHVVGAYAAQSMLFGACCWEHNALGACCLEYARVCSRERRGRCHNHNFVFF